MTDETYKLKIEIVYSLGWYYYELYSPDGKFRYRPPYRSKKYGCVVNHIKAIKHLRGSDAKVIDGNLRVQSDLSSYIRVPSIRKLT